MFKLVMELLFRITMTICLSTVFAIGTTVVVNSIYFTYIGEYPSIEASLVLLLVAIVVAVLYLRRTHARIRLLEEETSDALDCVQDIKKSLENVVKQKKPLQELHQKVCALTTAIEIAGCDLMPCRKCQMPMVAYRSDAPICLVCAAQQETQSNEERPTQTDNTRGAPSRDGASTGDGEQRTSEGAELEDADLFDSLTYIQRAYRVPAILGGRVRYNGQLGTIVGAEGGRLIIDLDATHHTGIYRHYHPTWNLEYDQ